ncbi:cysteine desulfurase family protein [Oscillatoria amoena NRMC-F 0135]|nr:cysteine desulfurase family protein [Oscillatoria laete-virens]MDL5051048.1 cysteine desulfurase family protein [Oscillatoria amoena NRMC-F 0135]MDL5054495.1 cysteine desulfurase family protein [Oscillatoria laete-virens NRMC-F 0139]
MLSEPVYLDFNATTPVDPEVAAAMRPFLEGFYGNPSSIHAYGREARNAIDEARDTVARALGAKPAEIIFTSGGTESDNLAILGLARRHRERGRHLVTTQIEHHAVLHAFEYLQREEGFEVTFLAPDSLGRISEEAFEKALRPDTILASVMSANNETGVLQPVGRLAALALARGVLFHTDAIQSFGKLRVAPHEWGVDAMSLCSHKFYGPKGAGMLFLKHGLPIDTIHYGGFHEGDRRPGTENVAAIVGFAKAVQLAVARDFDAEDARLRGLTEKLWDMVGQLPGARRNGDPVRRLGNTLNVSFAGLDGEELLINLDLEGIAISSGSACMVGSVQASHVLLAMGVPEQIARATVRFSLGKSTTEADIVRAGQATCAVVERLRKLRG